MKSTGQDVCADCGYDFDGTDFGRDPNCPECGKPARTKFVPTGAYVTSKAQTSPSVVFAIVFDGLICFVIVMAIINFDPSMLTWILPLAVALLVSIFGFIGLIRSEKRPGGHQRARMATILPGLLVLLVLLALLAWESWTRTYW